MKSSNLVSIVSSVLGLMVLTTVANAQSLYGTFGFVPIGNMSANNTDLSLATSLDLAPTEEVNTIPSTYLGVTNGYAPGQAYSLGIGAQITLTTTSITNGTLLGISFIANGTPFTFTATTPVAFTGSVSASGNFLAFSETGTLTDGPTFTAQASELAASFSQTSDGGAINGNFTFSTPPMPSTPEPGVVALFAGVALSSAGFVARRRK